MSPPITLKDIIIRTELKPGDLGRVLHMHGIVYGREYGYGLRFEAYVAEGLAEFCHQYDPATNRVWICEHDHKMIGFMVLMNRGQVAQLRYFIIEPAYRGIGLGKKLMELFMEALRDLGYKKVYLLTTEEQHAAAALYKRLGFQLVSEKESDIFDKPLREQRYELTITP
ncbi:MAG: GNAT family N-acetyltransferase [Cyclobacteriaceae bacterium]